MTARLFGSVAVVVTTVATTVATTVVAIVAAGLLLDGVAIAADPQPSQQNTERKIQQLQADIGKLEKKLRSAKGQQTQQNAALRLAEKEAGKLSRQISANQQQIKQQKKKISRFTRERTQLELQRDEQLAVLGDELAAAYRTGRQDRLRLLLNQQQPEQVTRMLRYHQYLSDARRTTVAEFEQTLSRLDQVEQQLTQQTQQLQAQQQLLQSRSKAMQQSRQQRKQALAALQKQVRTQSRSLKQLKANQQQLRQVLKELRQSLELNELEVTTQAFAKLKGKLRWPTTQTRVAQVFGSRSSQGIRRDGMLIRAGMGDTVKAVHNGRIVFSDWMRGYGLLLIMDHGDGYMSLYGHNQSLHQQVGDWVAAGEQIASAGDSGGQSQSGLYFALRYKGEPVNPKAWLRSR